MTERTDDTLSLSERYLSALSRARVPAGPDYVGLGMRLRGSGNETSVQTVTVILFPSHDLMDVAHRLLYLELVHASEL